MSQSFQIGLVLVLALLAANLPFLSQRVLLLGPLRAPKSLAWRLLEWLLMYLVVGAMALAFEKQAGQIAPQGWEFYAVTAAMFLTLAFPGFVYRYLMHRRG
ncbi:MAG: DUF2818 family protein [Betaproteobacteria bacterium]|nr:DUF2818 family protein [Betaproteobacteria bacterium]